MTQTTTTQPTPGAFTLDDAERIFRASLTVEGSLSLSTQDFLNLGRAQSMLAEAYVKAADAGRLVR